MAVTVLSNDPDLTRRQYGWMPFPDFECGGYSPPCAEVTPCCPGGGSLLQDTTSTRSLFYYLSVIRCAELLGKPVMLYANGIGPVHKAGQPPEGEAGGGAGRPGHPKRPPAPPGSCGTWA